MKSKQPSKASNTAGRRVLKLSPPARRSRTPWRTSPVTLIGAVDAPTAGVSTPGVRTDGVPVILIEDNRLLLEGLNTVLSAQGLKVVATARSGTQALRQVARLRPHLVLLDATLGDRNSLTMVRSLKKLFPDMKLIVMQLLPAQEDVVAFVRAGVSGFIMKDASLDDFVSTIRSVADGGSVLPPLVTGTLFSHVAHHAVTGKQRGVKAAMRLTARERKVTALIAEGLGNDDIAGRLRIPPHFVRSHVFNILEKLALHSRIDVANGEHARQELEKTEADASRPP